MKIRVVETRSNSQVLTKCSHLGRKFCGAVGAVDRTHTGDLLAVHSAALRFVRLI